MVEIKLNGKVIATINKNVWYNWKELIQLFRAINDQLTILLKEQKRNGKKNIK